MPSPPLDPDVADLAPDDPVLTAYDEQHVVTYLRLLDADADHADWREVAEIVLHIDPERYPERARGAFDSHLARARWMTNHGYGHLLRGRSRRSKLGRQISREQNFLLLRENLVAPTGGKYVMQP